MKKVSFREDDPAIFELFVKWLYVGMDFGPDGNESALIYAKDGCLGTNPDATTSRTHSCIV